ncbi:MAG: class I SAM-dependent methyltransferase [Patescibacteria group bacterium]
MRYYDPKNNRLIYIAEHASPEYWDRHWETQDLRKEITKKHFDRLVIPTTKKYLAPGSRVLEGGCGTGVHVYGLKQNRFESIGVDNAPETVRLAKEAVPEMDIRLGDVLQLNFPDNYFDGYWSIGVIEHFWNGYDAVLQEMQRVIKPGGYLFLTFPYMSPLRRWRTRRGKYPQAELARDDAPRHFYQFALDHKRVAQTFEQNGFTRVAVKPFDGFRGMRDEISWANRVLEPIARGKSMATKIIRLIIATLCRSGAGHSVLLVLQKTK